MAIVPLMEAHKRENHTDLVARQDPGQELVDVIARTLCDYNCETLACSSMRHIERQPFCVGHASSIKNEMG